MLDQRPGDQFNENLNGDLSNGIDNTKPRREAWRETYYRPSNPGVRVPLLNHDGSAGVKLCKHPSRNGIPKQDIISLKVAIADKMKMHSSMPLFEPNVLKIVCISDTHADDPRTSVPPGDMTDNSTVSEFEDVLNWVG